jgi:hypothetical protein
MSTKTLRKRIALAAVTALGAGLLSVVSTPAANATNNSALGVGNAAAAATILNIATELSITGSADLNAVGGETATTSLGLLANSTTQAAGALTSTATLRADGAASFYSVAADDIPNTIVVTGGTIALSTMGVDGISNTNVAKTQAVFGVSTAGGARYNFAVAPDTGATVMTVALYLGSSISGLAASNLVDIQAGTTSKGTLSQRYTITIGSAAASGVYSPTYSVFQMSAGSASTVDGIDTKNATTGSATIIPNGVAAQINWSFKDAFASALGAGAIAITSTAGGAVKSAALGSPAVPTNSVDVATTATGSITVAQVVANAPVTVTVSATRNGVAVGSKTITFLGEVAKVTVTPAKNGQTASSGASAAAATIAYADSAGNALYPTTESSTVVAASLGLSTVVSNVVLSRQPTSAPVSGTLDVTCAAAGNVAALQMRHINSASGSTILSNTWSQNCSGANAIVTASFDKASYAPGTIATLTLTFKDAKGNPGNAYDTLETITITGAPSTAAVTPLNPVSSTASGVTGAVTLQFVVGTTTGDFVAVIVPSDKIKTASGATQANLSVAYKVATTGTTVTNEQVLASIVSLIASINKQIVALQKLILQRR